MVNNTIIVSDIDDTIKWSHILGPEVIIDAPNYRLAFKGMPELYTSLANAGATVFYVTGAPDIVLARLHVDSIPQKVISENHFLVPFQPDQFDAFDLPMQLLRDPNAAMQIFQPVHRFKSTGPRTVGRGCLGHAALPHDTD